MDREEEKTNMGYVEPVPEFYTRLLALTNTTNQGLNKMGVLDPTSKARLSNLEDILSRLQTISEKELGNKELQQKIMSSSKTLENGLRVP